MDKLELKQKVAELFLTNEVPKSWKNDPGYLDRYIAEFESELITKIKSAIMNNEKQIIISSSTVNIYRIFGLSVNINMFDEAFNFMLPSILTNLQELNIPHKKLWFENKIVINLKKLKKWANPELISMLKND